MLYIETCSTATAACSSWVSHYLELAPNQLHGEVDLTSLQQLQTWLVHNHLCPRMVARLEYCIIFGRYCRGIGKRHEVLKAMAPTRLDCDSESKIRIGVLGHDFFKTLEPLLAIIA